MKCRKMRKAIKDERKHSLNTSSLEPKLLLGRYVYVLNLQISSWDIVASRRPGYKFGKLPPVKKNEIFFLVRDWNDTSKRRLNNLRIRLKIHGAVWLAIIGNFYRRYARKVIGFWIKTFLTLLKEITNFSIRHVCIVLCMLTNYFKQNTRPIPEIF